MVYTILPLDVNISEQEANILYAIFGGILKNTAN